MNTTRSMSENLCGALFTSKDAEQLQQPAIQSAGRDLSYQDLLDQIRHAAQTLHGLGVRKSDRVVLCLKNSPEFVVAFFAASDLGAVVVPLEPGAGSDRLRFMIGETRPRVCLHHGRSPLWDVPETRHVTLAWNPESARLEFSTGQPAIFDPTPVGGGDPALILYSAGSTGRPKGVVLQHGQLLAIADSLSGIVGLHPGHRELILNPLTHSGAWQRVTSTFLTGGRIVFPDGMFSVPNLIEHVEQHGISGFFTTPPFIRMMLATAPEKFSGRVDSLESIEIASAPLTADELGRLMRLLPTTRVFFQYGSTECSRAFMLDTSAHPDKLHTVGRPTPGVQVRVRGPQGSWLEPGQDGEVLLTAPQLTHGYWQRTELDAQRFEDGWLRTGDFGSVDDAGFLTLRGRQDEMINCGGHSFFPAEVEVALGAVSGVSRYLIAGVPDPQRILTQVGWAFVVPEASEDWSPAEFLSLARRRLPPHMVPRNVVVIPAIPLTPSGKPSRRLALEMYGPEQQER